jgi:hypothetical protein
MPNRILRDWTDSETVDMLSVNAERFFTRLIMKVDDFGRFTANVRMLKSVLFPLKTDVRETDITRWLAECEKSGLIALYGVASKDYLQINNFKQALRQKVEKYPAPQLSITCIADETQMNSTCVLETKRNESEVETETKDAPVKKFVKPDEYLIKDFFIEIGLDDFTADAQGKLFFSYYESNGWRVGKNSMKDWHAAARGWKERMNDYKKPANGTIINGNSQNGKAGRSEINDRARSAY